MDREKVIKGLECCLGSNDCDVEPEEDCPYKWMCLCAMALRFDILALLKEQEPQLVLNIGEQISCKSGSCPNCRKMLNTTSNKKFCGDCGQEVKWDG